MQIEIITCTSYSSILHVLICRASVTLRNKGIRGFVACAPTHCTFSASDPCMHRQSVAPGSVCVVVHARMPAHRPALVLFAPTNPSAPCTYVRQRPNQCVWSFNHCSGHHPGLHYCFACPFFPSTEQSSGMFKSQTPQS